MRCHGVRWHDTAFTPSRQQVRPDKKVAWKQASKFLVKKAESGKAFGRTFALTRLSQSGVMPPHSMLALILRLCECS